MTGVILTDGDGRTWDIGDTAEGSSGGGAIDNGTIDEYDGGFALQVNGTILTTTFGAAELSGRQQVLTGTVGVIAVERRFYVPTTTGEGWMRVLDSFTNTSGAAVTITVRSQSNSGNDSGFQILSTSSGDTAFTTADTYIINDDGNLTGGDLALLTLFGDGSRLPSAVSNTVYTSSGTQGIDYSFSLTIQSGQTVSLLQFASQQTQFSDFASELPTLTTPDAEALSGLTGTQISQVVNFALTPPTGGQTISGTPNPDVLSGTSGNDTISGLASNDTIFGNDGDDTIDGGTGADVMVGGLGDDTMLVDDAGDQVLESLNGGTDTVIASVSYTLQQGTYVERLNAATGSAAINLVGNELGQTINGNAGNNVLVGNGTSTVTAGVFDTLVGGLGNDTYLVRQAGDVVTEAANGGTDIVYSDVSYALAAGSEVEALSASTQSSTANLNFTGNEFSQTIVGTFGNNLIRGGGGIDTLIGLAGNDTYVVSQTGTVIGEAVGGGTDTVFVTAGAGGVSTYTLNAGAEVEVLSTQDVTASSTVTLKGNEFSQQIFGDAGANVLWSDGDTVAGNGGTDTLTGFAGNDIYHVDSLNDVVIESAGGGTTDIVFAAGNYALTAGTEVEGLLGEGFNLNPVVVSDTDSTLDASATYSTSTASQYLVGNGLQVAIYASNGANIIDPGAPISGTPAQTVLLGLDGNDVYRVYRQEDRVVEDNGEGTDTIYTSASYSLLVNDANTAFGIAFENKNEIEQLIASDATATTAINLTGNALNQYIVGNAGANILNSGGGVDTLIGLGGDDTYVVSNTGTVVIEAAGGGNDIVYVAASVTSSYILTDGSYVESLSAVDQLLTDAINITGNTFVQTIVGNAGNNILNSGGGADTLIGLAGNDTYRVYGQGEVITEAASGGTDTVFTSGTYTLTAGAEIETFSTADQLGTQAIDLTGNATSQTIIGNYGNNVLTGGGTSGDTLQGLFGDDTYVIKAGDTIIEVAGQGNDTALTSASYTLAGGVSVETLSVAVTSTTNDVNLTGNELANKLIGNDGINILDGKLGNDTLVGGGRGDTFMFSTALNATTNVDFIQDFASGDRIGLATNIFVGTVATSPNGQLQADQFVVGTAALDANDFIVYNQATGQIFYDADGNGSGAAVLFATVNPGTVLAAADFAPIAGPSMST